MPKKNADVEPPHDIVSSVFEDFLAALSNKAIAEQRVIERLRSALLEEHDLSVETIRHALFPEEFSR